MKSLPNMKYWTHIDNQRWSSNYDADKDLWHLTVLNYPHHHWEIYSAREPDFKIGFSCEFPDTNDTVIYDYENLDTMAKGYTTRIPKSQFLPQELPTEKYLRFLKVMKVINKLITPNDIS